VNTRAQNSFSCIGVTSNLGWALLGSTCSNKNITLNSGGNLIETNCPIVKNPKLYLTNTTGGVPSIIYCIVQITFCECNYHLFTYHTRIKSASCYMLKPTKGKIFLKKILIQNENKNAPKGTHMLNIHVNIAPKYNILFHLPHALQISISKERSSNFVSGQRRRT